jgi:hypothetical protein
MRVKIGVGECEWENMNGENMNGENMNGENIYVDRTPWLHVKLHRPS